MRRIFCSSVPVAGAIFTGLAFLGVTTTVNAATLTVTPSSVSNYYTGPITLQITGLTNTEPVLVQRFLDANSNGVVDAGEPLVQSFRLTEGQVTGFGGVRDINVPGDDDGATNSQIQCDLKFSNSAELARMVGSYVIRASSPSGRFSPVTQSLTVTQSAFAQRVTGQITSSSVGVPYAGVALLVQSGNNMEFVEGIWSDASGNFSLNCPVGEYVMISSASGYVFDMSAASPIDVTASQVVTQNVSLTIATTTLAGSVRDIANSNGIPGVQFFLESDGNNLAIAFSDTNGVISVPVVADNWKIDISDFSLKQSGYLRIQNKVHGDTSTGAVNNVSFQLPRETALIYGYVKDQTNAPIAGFTMNCNSSNNVYDVSATTDGIGYYVCGVQSGFWFIGPDNSVTNYNLNGTNVNVLDGQAVLVNLTARQTTAHLRGTIQDGLGSPLANITLVVQPSPVTNNNSSAYPSTDGSGHFDVAVSGGNWNIALECTDASSRDYVNVNNYNYAVTDGVDQNGLVLSFPAATAHISGTVVDSLGNPIPNVTLDANSGIYYPGCVSTDGSGHYQIGVLNGTWNVQVRDGDLNSFGYNIVNGQNVIVSGGNQSANFTAQPIPPVISQPRMVSGQFQFTLNGYNARQYRIEATTNFSSWINLGTNQPSNGTFLFSDPGTSSSVRRFYRASVAH
jgi:hypothetical protein